MPGVFNMGGAGWSQAKLAKAVASRIERGAWSLRCRWAKWIWLSPVANHCEPPSRQAFRAGKVDGSMSEELDLY